jgi:N-acetylglucosaminyldiphosphoundecaprenol N-acetyl-beta-D-mannosaminyltransferase
MSLVPEDEALRLALQSADLNLPDGSPVAWLGRRFGTDGPVRGPDLLVNVARAGVDLGVKHYLYGGSEGAAEDVAVRLQTLVPGVRVVGAESPPWTDLDEQGLRSLACRIRQSEATVVWIGLGTPRQDYLVPRLAPLVDRVLVPVGAAFDYHSGRVREAPKVLHGSGLEWIYRLMCEPRRLFRRYTVGNLRFAVHAFRTRTSP